MRKQKLFQGIAFQVNDCSRCSNSFCILNCLKCRHSQLKNIFPCHCIFTCFSSAYFNLYFPHSGEALHSPWGPWQELDTTLSSVISLKCVSSDSMCGHASTAKDVSLAVLWPTVICCEVEGVMKSVAMSLTLLIQCSESYIQNSTAVGGSLQAALNGEQS